MLKIIATSIAALLISLLVIACSHSRLVSQDDGFVSLFNGKNFDGWYIKMRNADEVITNKTWTVENGIIHVFRDLPDAYELDTGKNNTHGMIYTHKKYSQYVFKFEYKWGKKRSNNFGQFQYDAGMYYHNQTDEIWPKGIEYQIRYDHTKNRNHTGDFWAPRAPLFQWYSTDGITFTPPHKGGKPVTRKTGEHLGATDAIHHGLDDQWNQCEVIVMGNQYVIYKLNGNIVNMGTDLAYSEGNIGLQSETAEIFYRNIRIKEYKTVPPMEEFIRN